MTHKTKTSSELGKSCVFCSLIITSLYYSYIASKKNKTTQNCYNKMAIYLFSLSPAAKVAMVAIARQQQTAVYEVANSVLEMWLEQPQQQLFLGDVMAAKGCRSFAGDVTFNNTNCPDEVVRSLKRTASRDRIPVALLSWLIFEKSSLLANPVSDSRGV